MDTLLSRKQKGSYSKALCGSSFSNQAKVSSAPKNGYQGHYANKYPDAKAKAKDGKGIFKLRQLEEPSLEKKDDKSIRQIRIRQSEPRSDSDPFLCYWVKVYDRYLSHPGYLPQLFADTGSNCKNFYYWFISYGVHWHTSLVGEHCIDSTRIINIDTFGKNNRAL